MKSYKAILFDFDGVIARTMDDNYAAWRYAFSRYGIVLERLEYFLLEGMSVRKVALQVLAKHSRSQFLAEDIVSLKEKFYQENNRFSMYEGVTHLLRALKAGGFLLGLVSGGSYARISTSMEPKHFDLFDIVVSGDRVSNPKPHPEPYLNAALGLGVDPLECLVVENAPLGIKSAKSAGMYCVAVPTTLGRDYLFEADAILDALTDIEGLLAVQEKASTNEEKTE